MPTEWAARDQWRIIADQLREGFPKIAKLMDETDNDVLAPMTLAKEHRTKIHSTNPLERLNDAVEKPVSGYPLKPGDLDPVDLRGERFPHLVIE